MSRRLISVGRKVEFDPFDGIRGFAAGDVRKLIAGTIVAVYRRHGWFLVEYGVHKLKIGFKFQDVGQVVTIKNAR